MHAISRNSNPVLHELPNQSMTPAQMHRELNKEIHADCTLKTCAISRYCWVSLKELSHAHPHDMPEDCGMCTPRPEGVPSEPGPPHLRVV